ncbi:hypothetical protein Mycch_1009 [Mycolicibacterium chubuense NBB4]|uniref:Peptide chain release factor 1 n=1 Tax=Mycolicibacterium chubuense (strain NBB4) TaxID=710421 RepID=I4BEW2_MYCCN|nr:hypothetical protein [Mycolicibacterium chubuense]AFM15819.1 hypothetical protein Mycch_1009 [Mycolicibacterium chubuense NBB4]
METERFRRLAGAPGPFVSLYIDDTRDTHDAEKQAAARWSAIRRHLEDSEVAEHVIGAVERAVLHSRPAVGRQGRAVIAGSEGVLINELLGSPPAITVLRVSDYPYFLPLLELGTSRPAYVFAAADLLGADLTMHRGGIVVHETVEGEGYPVHKPVTAGWNGYGDLQHTTEEAVRMNARAIADRITDMVDRCNAELVFLCGEVRSRSDVLLEMPQRIAECVVSLPARAQGGRPTEREMADLIDEEFERRRHDATSVIMARFEAEDGRGSGLAVAGLRAVCAALRDGAVATLIVGDLGGTTVVSGPGPTAVAPDADTLSEWGEAPYRVALADEALPFAAVAGDAAVVRPFGDVTFDDGVAALLRYPQAGSARPEGLASGSAQS